VISALPFELLNPEPIFHLNLPNGAVDTPQTYSMFQRAMERISMNPELADEVYALYGGERYPALPDGVPDSEKRDLSDDSLNVLVDLDPGRIKAICAQNGFNHPIGPKDAIYFDKEDGMSCLHIFPSYFNHSCVPNAGYAALPQYLAIRALRAIKEGEEVFLSYGGFAGNLNQRTDRLKKWFDGCDCRLCLCDRGTPPAQTQKRQELLNGLLTSSSGLLKDFKEKVQQIDASYPDNYPNLRWEAFRAHGRLAQILKIVQDRSRNHSQCPEIVQSGMAALEAIGALVTDKSMAPEPSRKETEGEGLPISTDQVPYLIPTAVYICLDISQCFKRMGIDWRAMQWLKAAIWRVWGDDPVQENIGRNQAKVSGNPVVLGRNGA
ncbi:1322_t:CDS:2, partial [Acaulospora colombiana]